MLGLTATVGRAVICDYDPSPDAAAAAQKFLDQSTFVDSGTSALALALQDAIGRGNFKGDAEIILPAYCCPDVLSAVHYNNARPVLVDLEPDTTWMDLDLLRRALNQNTAAVIAVNFLGIAERLGEIRSLLNGHNGLLIDDSCQAVPDPGGAVNEADYRIFSFGRGKPISLLHGGAVQSRFGKCDIRGAGSSSGGQSGSRIAECLRGRVFNAARHPLVFRCLYAMGAAGNTDYSPPHEISPMRDWPLAVLPAALQDISRRQNELAKQIESVLLAGNASQPLSLPHILQGAELPRLLRYPLLVPAPSRSGLMAEMHRAGISATAMYAKPLPDINNTSLDATGGDYPVALNFSQKLITLPLHEDISGDNVGRMLDVLVAARR